MNNQYDIPLNSHAMIKIFRNQNFELFLIFILKANQWFLKKPSKFAISIPLSNEDQALPNNHGLFYFRSFKLHLQMIVGIEDQYLDHINVM